MNSTADCLVTVRCYGTKMSSFKRVILLLIVFILDSKINCQLSNFTINDVHYETKELNETLIEEIDNNGLRVIDNLDSNTTDFEERTFFTYKITDVSITNGSYVSITTPNYPEPYPNNQTTIEWLVGFGEGFGVEIIIRDLDIDGNTNDYVILIPGGTNYDEKDAVMYSWYLKKERKYRLLHLDELTIKFVTNKKANNNTHRGFKIDVKRVGENPTTTEIPTTEPPSLILNEEQIATLYLGGKTPNEFMNVSDAFKMELARIAEIYSIDKNITITENISIYDNVKYHLVSSCKISWPDSENCVKITYSITVYFDNETLTYELNSEHLNDMWSQYNEKMNLEKLGLKVYPLPNDQLTFWTWMGVSLGVIVWFFIILYAIWRYRYYFREDYQQYSMRDSLVSMKKSDASLFPIPHQSVPPLFGYDNFSQDDKFWYEDMPPEYTEEFSESFKNRGENNFQFTADGELFNLDSDEEIIMSLPDQTKEQELRKQNIGEDIGNNESYL